MPKSIQKLFVVALLASSSIVAFATDNLSAKLFTLGPNDPIHTYWGHIGIAIENMETGEDLFYDFGNFSFYSENFYTDIFNGQMRYLSDVIPTDIFIRNSIQNNMDIITYTLNLGDDELRELDRILRWWVLPENSVYLYNYFLNNCSTIIRNILNQITDGQLKKHTLPSSYNTFRHYTRIGAYQSLPAEIMLHYILGPFTDESINGWELMFLPDEVARTISDFKYMGRDGIQRILAGEKKILYRASRPSRPENLRTSWPILLLLSVLIALVWAMADDRIWWRIAQSLVVFCIGFPGLVLGYFMIFTDHFVTYGNINIWPTFPTIMLALVPIWRTAMQHRNLIIALIWTINLAGLLLSIFLNLSGLSPQNASMFWVLCGFPILVASYPGFLIFRTWRQS